MTKLMTFRVNGLCKSFSTDNGMQVVFDGLSLDIRDGEFLAILGGSGCGKSTFLRMLAGFVKPDAGTLSFNDAPIIGPHAGIGYLPQAYDLFPWKTVDGNVSLGLLQLRLGKREQADRVADLVRMVKLDGHETALPKNLSGGMRQRVALARTLATSPDALLLDEPFGALDAHNREDHGQMVRQLFDNRTIKTVVLITHDIDEAIRYADRVLVFGGAPTRITFASATRNAEDSAPTNSELATECRRWLT